MGKSKEKHVGALSHSHEDNPLVVEARMQSKALGTLAVYRRLAYSVVAIGALLIYWSVYADGGTVQLVIGILLLVVAVPCAALLHIGISHGKANVQKIIDALQQEADGDKNTPE